MGILKIVDYVAYARKLRHHVLSMLRDSLRSHVAGQRYDSAIRHHVDGVGCARRTLVSGQRGLDLHRDRRATPCVLKGCGAAGLGRCVGLGWRARDERQRTCDRRYCDNETICISLDLLVRKFQDSRFCAGEAASSSRAVEAATSTHFGREGRKLPRLG
jgi:hypothetical protein